MRRVIQSVFLICACLSMDSARAQICKWVDENGVTHYETKCPEDGSADVLDLDTGPGGESSEEAGGEQQAETFEPLVPGENAQSEIALAPPQPSVLENAEARERCVRAMTNLVVLQLQAPVFYDDQGVLRYGLSDGSRDYEGARTYVSDEEREDESLRYRNFLRDSCGQSQADREQIADLFAAQNLQGIQQEICAEKVNLMNRLEVGVTGLPISAADELRGYLELNCN